VIVLPADGEPLSAARGPFSASIRKHSADRFSPFKRGNLNFSRAFEDYGTLIAGLNNETVGRFIAQSIQSLRKGIEF
jgi:hypothetical protein